MQQTRYHGATMDHLPHRCCNIDEVERMQRLTHRSIRIVRARRRSAGDIADDQIEITSANPCFIGPFLVPGRNADGTPLPDPM